MSRARGHSLPLAGYGFSARFGWLTAASLMGGKGSIAGTILDAIILGAMRNGLTLPNVQALYQLLATGIIILLAMLLDRLARGKE